jgi:hypothetical protein
MEEHFVFVVQANLTLKIARVDTDGKPHTDLASYSLTEHVGLVDGAVQENLTERTHTIHCVVKNSGDDGFGQHMRATPPPSVLVCITLVLQAGPVVIVLQVDVGVDDTAVGEHAVKVRFHAGHLLYDVISVVAGFMKGTSCCVAPSA